MNPGVNWTRLQIGQKLRVPGKVNVAKASAKKPASTAKHAGKVAVGPTKRVKVRSGDNDWILARRAGVTVAQIRRVNPKVNWAKLKVGSSVNVPVVYRKPSPGYASIPTKRALVNASNVNVRSAPSTTSRFLRQVPAGAVGTILDRETGWYKLKFASGSIGWVKGTLLKPLKTSSYIAQNKSSRSARASYTAQRTTGSKGNTVRSHSNPIVRSSGTYVTARPVSGSSLINRAYDFLGTRYRYGGTSRSGIDCSGFSQAVYKSQGISIPRTSSQQSKVGKSVPKETLKQGDLVFFRTRGGSRVSHVGVYVGNGRFIHASSGKGRVTTSSLSEGYYSRRYAGARRVSSKVSKGDADNKDEDKQAMKVAEKQLKSDGVDPKPEPQKTNLGTDEITR